MKQDAALDKWIEDDMRDVPCVLPADEASEYMCREAWHAAVKHTLEFVVNELHRGPWHEGKIKFETIEAISKMKP